MLITQIVEGDCTCLSYGVLNAIIVKRGMNEGEVYLSRGLIYIIMGICCTIHSKGSWSNRGHPCFDVVQVN